MSLIVIIFKNMYLLCSVEGKKKKCVLLCFKCRPLRRVCSLFRRQVVLNKKVYGWGATDTSEKRPMDGVSLCIHVTAHHFNAFSYTVVPLTTPGEIGRIRICPYVL